MNKFCALICLISLISCQKETKENNVIDEKIPAQWNDFGLKGKVKSAVEFTNELTPNFPNNSRKFENQSLADIGLTFDKNGKLIEKAIFNENGTYSELTTYNGKDKILAQKKYISQNDFIDTKYSWEDAKNTIITRRKTDGSLLDKEVFLHNNDGNNVEKYKYDHREVQVARTSYSYDAKDRIIEEINYQDKQVMQTRLSIEYDDNNNKISESLFDKNYKLQWKTLFNYENNLLVSSKTFVENDKLEVETTIKYDAKKRVIFKETFEKYDNSTHKEEYDYDANDNLISWKVYKNNQIINQIISSFDKNNNLLSQKNIDKNKKTVYQKNNTYIFDKNNNWISRESKINNEKIFTTKREIVYY